MADDQHSNSPDGHHCLCVVAGEHEGQLARIDEQSLVIGRDPSRSFHLPDAEVSRAHCEIWVADGVVQVRDLGSTNGTWIDSQRVRGRGRLPLGSVLQLGQHVLRHDLVTDRDLERGPQPPPDVARALAEIETLIPPPFERNGLSVDHCLVPSAQLGGNALGHRWIDDGRLAMFVIDVSGRGFHAATHAAAASAALHCDLTEARELMNPGRVLSRLHSSFLMEQHGDLTVTIWYGVLDVDSGALAYASGGPAPALVLSAGGRVVGRLTGQGPPVGSPEGGRFAMGGARLERDQRLLVFGAGAVEATGTDGRVGTLESFEALLADHPRATPDEVFTATCARRGQDVLDDDFALLVVDRGRPH